MVDEYPDGNIPENEKKAMLKKVPIFASIAVGETDADKDNYMFRVASKRARNKKNNASELEKEFIKTFEDNDTLNSLTYTNNETNELWVMRPVRLSEKQGCLECHGSPDTSPWGNGKDVLGYELEDYQDGDIEGLFIIKSSLDANNNEVQANIRNAIWEIILIMLGVLIIVFIISSYFIKKTNSKIDHIVQANKKIANGDLSEKLPEEGSDEFAEIFRHLNIMSDSLKTVIKAVNEAADLLVDESSSSKDLSRQLASSTNTQAAAVEEISVSMEEMSATIDQTSEHAQTTETIAKTSALEIETSNDSSKKAIDSMFSIKEELNAIGDIAKQTNILALNASVEAARAGTAGAGFSVVAGEVRKLAERSKHSAEKIETLFSNGVKIVNLTSDKLTQLVPDITKTYTLLSEIVASSMEQSSGASEINNAVQGLNNVTQTNAQIADNMTAKADKLNHYATLLRDRISFFKIK
jgi:methyl-accepting chemotaxis protein